jgi:hypothetical protein
VRQQVLDRHVAADQRQVAAEQRPRRRRQRQHAVLDQPRNCERRQALRAARDRESRLERVRNRVRAIREAVCRRERDLLAAVDAQRAGEARIARERADLVVQRYEQDAPTAPHERHVPPSRFHTSHAR